jgi:predicted TIM-barrel fold metal-dependent hydrolase
LGDPSFQAVWQELNRRKTVVYTHPITPGCCGNLNDEVPAVAIEWATDTTRTIASLVFSGVANRYPDIRWIFSHGGGTMPFLLSRFQYQEKTMKDRAARIPNGLMYELQRFYYDTAQANHPAALAALEKIVTPAQLLFGTDFPYRDGAEVIAGLSAHGFSDQDLSGIERYNAVRLIPGV